VKLCWTVDQDRRISIQWEGFGAPTSTGLPGASVLFRLCL